MKDLPYFLEGLDLGGPQHWEKVEELRTSYPWIPQDYFTCLVVADGFEGSVRGRGYLRIWSAEEATRLNREYHIAEFLPFTFLFGTDAAVIGYCFDQRYEGHVFSVELAALDDEYLTKCADSFSQFLSAAAEDGQFPPQPVGAWGAPAHIRGHVIHERHPIVLGGAVNNPDNRVLIPADKQPEFSVLWTRTLRHVRAGSRSGSGATTK